MDGIGGTKMVGWGRVRNGARWTIYRLTRQVPDWGRGAGLAGCLCGGEQAEEERGGHPDAEREEAVARPLAQVLLLRPDGPSAHPLKYCCNLTVRLQLGGRLG